MVLANFGSMLTARTGLEVGGFRQVQPGEQFLQPAIRHLDITHRQHPGSLSVGMPPSWTLLSTMTIRRWGARQSNRKRPATHRQNRCLCTIGHSTRTRLAAVSGSTRRRSNTRRRLGD